MRVLFVLRVAAVAVLTMSIKNTATIMVADGLAFPSSSLNRRDAIQQWVAKAAAVTVTVAPSSCYATISITDTSHKEDKAEKSSEQERKEREETLRRLQERRQLMQASRSSNNRQSYLDLSRQRAALYNTTYQGVTCPPNIPCI